MHRGRDLRWVLLTIALLAAPGCGRLTGKGPSGPSGAHEEVALTGDVLEAPLLIRGKVMAVDRRAGLVMINVGERHGVRERYGLTVTRQGKPIGRVVVSDVFPDLCAARLGPSTAAAVKIGDDVTTRTVPD